MQPSTDYLANNFYNAKGVSLYVKQHQVRLNTSIDKSFNIFCVSKTENVGHGDEARDGGG